MELHAAEQLALRLMAEFGLRTSVGEMWHFKFDNAKRRFGRCSKSRKLITLSRVLTVRNDQAQVEDTIRHEIAHALCAPKEGHGENWKKMCVRVGANPERCYDSAVVSEPKGDWNATCNGCGTMHTKFRRPKRELWCAVKTCVRENGKRSPLQKLEWHHRNEVRINVVNEKRAAALAAVKEQLKREQEMEDMKRKIAALEQKFEKEGAL